MVYKRYIKRGGKTFGPYFYESYRDNDGKVKTQFVSGPGHYEKKGSVTSEEKKYFNLKLYSYVGLGIIIVVALLIAINSSVTGNVSWIRGSEFIIDREIASSLISVGDNFFTFITGLVTDEGGEESGSSGDESSGISDTGESDSESDDSSESSDSDDSDSSESNSEDIESDDESNEEVEKEEAEDEESEEESYEEEEEEESGDEEEIEEDEETETETEEVVNDTEIDDVEINETEGNESIIVNVEGNETVGNESIIVNVEGNETVGNESDGNEIIVSNETVIGNESVDIINITQFGARLGEPVKWKRTVNVSGNANVKIEIPDVAEKVVVNKIKKDEIDVDIVVDQSEVGLGEAELSEGGEIISSLISGNIVRVEREKIEIDIEGRVTVNPSNLDKIRESLINIFRVTGFVVEEKVIETQEIVVEVSELDGAIEIEYETPAPSASEIETGSGKKVVISSPEGLHYENVIAFTNLNEKFDIKDRSRVKILWEEEGKYLPPILILDNNGNGVFDYIEWVAPRLSNQTFNIIVITAAEHLNESREFISDIYEDAKELDGNWTESIPDGHYVRVVFERNLSEENDITVYPRIVSGAPRIEVYELNESIILAEFGSLVDEQYNKIYLVNLSETQDTFDLRVVDGVLEFDHIIDPTQEFFEDCASITDWTLQDSGSGWSVASTQCRGGVANNNDMNMTSANISLTGETNANLTFNYSTASIQYFRVYASDDGADYVKLFEATGTNSITDKEFALEDSITLTSTVSIKGQCKSDGRSQNCFWDNINVTSYDFPDNIPPDVTINVPDNVNYSSGSDIPINFNVSLSESGSVLYSLDGGLNNVSMRVLDGGPSGTEFNHTNTSLADGAYTFSVYANDTVGNINYSESVNFDVGQIYKFSENIVESVHSAPLNESAFVLAWCDESDDDVTFKVYSTAGNNLTGDVDVDTAISACEGDYGVSVSAFNSTAFVVGYFDLSEADASFNVFDIYGNSLTGEIDASTSAGIAYSSISVSAFNETAFVIGWINTQGVTHLGKLAVYNANGTAITSTVQFDSSIGGLSAGNSRVGVSTFNDTTFALGYYDVNSGNITAMIYDSYGNFERGFTVDDDVQGSENADSVSISTFNSTAFVVGWYDGQDGDASFRIYKSDGSAITAITDADSDVGASKSVSVSAINESSFAIGYYDDTDGDSTFAVFNSNGGNIMSAIDADKTSQEYQQVASYSAATDIGICDNNLLMGWVRGNTSDLGAYWNSYYGNNGSLWNGICPEPADLTAPVVTIVFPVNRTYKSDDLPLNFNVSLNEVGSVIYSLDGGLHNYSMSANATGTGFTDTNSTISDGEYRFYVYANDSSNNLNYTASVNFSVDQIPPAVTIDFPENTTYEVFDLPLNFSVTLNEFGSAYYTLDGGLHNYTMYEDDNPIGTTLNHSNSSIAFDSYTFSVYANDSAGNINHTENVTFAFSDLTPPVVTVNFPVNQTYNADDLPLNFNVSLNEVGYVVYSLDGGLHNYSMSANATGTGFTDTNASISDGEYRFYVYANDSYDNLNYSFSVNFTVDQTPPAVTIDFPANTTYYSDDGPFNFSITLDDQGSAFYSLDGGLNNNTMFDGTNAIGTELNHSNSTIAIGSYIFRVFANDTNGNRNYTENITFSVADSLIGLEIVSPANLSLVQNVTKDTFFNVTFNVSCLRGNCGLINVTLDPEVVVERAWHLDENRNKISDISDEINELGDIVSEEIKDGEFVRVKFERELDKGRDIKILPKEIRGKPKIEVYEENRDYLIAEFDDLKNGAYSEVVLSRLLSKQNTFDLKVVGGSLKIDHIIDPTITFSTNRMRSVDAAAFNNTGFVLFWCDDTEEDATFAIYNTDGTVLAGPTDVDTGIGNCGIGGLHDKVGVSVLNSTAFVVIYDDINNIDVEVFDDKGNQLGSLINLDDSSGASDTTAISAFDDNSFVGAWFDQISEDVSFVTSFINGTTIKSITDVDTTAGAQAYSVSVSTFNDSAFVIGWLDDDSDDISFRIYEKSGTALSAVVDVDTLSTKGTISVATINNSAFVVSYYDNSDSDISYEIFKSNGTQIESEVVLDNFVGNSGSTKDIAQSVTRINSTAFVVAWDDAASSDISYEVHSTKTEEIVNQTDVDTTALDWVGVVSQEQTTEGFCNGNFIIPFANTNSSQQWISLQPNGTGWDGTTCVASEPELKAGIISTVAGTTPFFTNASYNPFNITLSSRESMMLYFWVNATGELGTNHTFFGYSNFSTNHSNGNRTYSWNVSIKEAPIAISIDLSDDLNSQINWTISFIPTFNHSAEGNNDEGDGFTDYWVNLSVSGGNADLYMRANSDLRTSADDIIGLGNETFSFNSTNQSVPDYFKNPLTTDYNDNKIASAVTGESVVYLKFFINAPTGTAAGTYNNTIEIKAVEEGVSP
jgi:hypothetical protein